MKFYISIIILFLGNSSNAQSINLTSDYVDTWKETHPFQGYYSPTINEYYTGLIFASIHQHNTIQKMLGLRDTITVHRNGQQEFDYKLNDISMETKGGSLFITGHNSDTDVTESAKVFNLSFRGGNLNSTYHTSDSTYYTISTSAEDEFEEDNSIELNSYTHGFLDGRSEHVTNSGRVLHRGHYMLKDTMYRDTILEFTDRSDRVMVYTRLYVPKKCGTWTETLDGGKVENIEYPDCPDK